MKYRMRTLLAVTALAAALAGAGRYWYDVHVAPSRADEAVAASPEFEGVIVRWSGPPSGWLHLHRRASHVWFDDAATFSAAAERLGELPTVASVQVLGRQLMPHVHAAARGQPDRVIEAWRRHPALRRVFVDASVRGAPLGNRVELYKQDDRAALQSVLPDVEIIWMEVH